MAFELSKITGNEPPIEPDADLKTCGICDNMEPGGLEACSDCYNDVSGKMDLYQAALDTPAIVCVIGELKIKIKAIKGSLDDNILYTAKSGYCGVEGQGITKSQAVADLLASLWLRK